MAEEKNSGGRPKGVKNKQTLLADELQALQTQLLQALDDASALQHSKRKDESYISEMKLVSTRISALERQIARVENALDQPLHEENAKLKRDLAAARLENETLKKQPQTEPVIPLAPWETQTTLERMRAGKPEVKSEVKTEVKTGLSAVKPEPTPTPTNHGSSFPLELLNFGRIPLYPPRETDIVPVPPLERESYEQRVARTNREIEAQRSKSEPKPKSGADLEELFRRARETAAQLGVSPSEPPDQNPLSDLLD